MRKVVITQEIIDSYPYKSSPNRPHRPYCRLCANFDRRIWVGGGKRRTNFNVKVLAIGEEAILVKFRNGTVGYYHLSCWNDPRLAWKVDNIKNQSVE